MIVCKETVSVFPKQSDHMGSLEKTLRIVNDIFLGDIPVMPAPDAPLPCPVITISSKISFGIEKQVRVCDIIYKAAKGSAL